MTAEKLPADCPAPPKGWQKEQLLSGGENECGWFGASGYFQTLFADESGNRLDLYCHEREYALWYVSSAGYARQIGRCPWGGGQNQADISHSGDRMAPAGVDCIESVFWRSVESRIPLLGHPQGDGSLVDWKEFTYSPAEDKLVLRHFTSPDGPGGEQPDQLVKKNISYGKAITADILNFNPDPQMRQFPMRTFQRPLCDVDRNGNCDTEDFKTLRVLLGHCENSPAYNALADIDHDGCITAGDYEMMLSIRAADPIPR